MNGSAIICSFFVLTATNLTAANLFSQSRGFSRLPGAYREQKPTKKIELLSPKTACQQFQSIVSFSPDDSVQKKGSIRGSVVDKDARLPMIGVNVILKGTRYGAATNVTGGFIISNVPVGTYTLTFHYIGYEPLSITDVIVRSNRISFVNTELRVSAIESEGVVVSAGYFPELETQPTSVARFSSEEIRRAATVGGDINRIIDGLPSLSNENQNNYIVARGGSNIENSFYIDNIRVPNLNHFPIPGTTGGGVSLLNVDFIKDINIYTGGFAANYGDALSSVMDVRYREGNREEVDLQTDLNFTGVSGAIEGPLGIEGSYLISAKHSFTDILFKIANIDQEPVVYDEIQGKFVYDLSPNHKISLINLFGSDRWNIPREDAISRSDNGYGNFNMTENVVGLNWLFLWGRNGFSNTSLSHTITNTDVRFLKTLDQTERFVYKTSEQNLELRNSNYLNLSSDHHVEFGFDLKRIKGDYDNYFATFINQYGTVTPELRINDEIRTWQTGFFLSYIWNPVASLDIIPGLRVDYFQYNKNAFVSPRFSSAYHFNERTSASVAAGIYYQHLPMFFLAQNRGFNSLDDMTAYHFVAGFNHLLSEDTRLVVEVYNKEYRHCPMDQNQPSLFILDENIYNQFYSYHEEMVSTGKARVQGIELMLQKKLSGHFYGLVSGTYYRAKYRDLNGVWRNRVTDNRYLISTELGYKPNSKWEFSLRWSYAGGIPYTPYDQQASQNAGSGIYDKSKIMSNRLPAYRCLNTRVDRRFYFKNTNLIVFLSIWNILNRKNVSYHFWDEYGGSAGDYTQWPRLPVFGVEFEF